jgi:hypothetical protein
MKALARVLAAAAVLAALGVLAAGVAEAASPQVDQGTVERPHATQHRQDRVWRCNSGHGPQFDCADPGWLHGSRPSPDPAAPAPPGRGGPLALVRSVALLGLLAGMAAAGDWLRHGHWPRERSEHG